MMLISIHTKIYATNQQALEFNDHMTVIATFCLMREEAPQKYVFDIPGLYCIGRGKDCNLSIPKELDNSISRLHCQILLTDSSLYVRDTGSSNGTYVNDNILENGTTFLNSHNPETTDIEINQGDMLKVGHTIFQVDIAAETPSQPQPAPPRKQPSTKTKIKTIKKPTTPKIPSGKGDTVVSMAAAPSVKKQSVSPSSNGIKMLSPKNKNKNLIKIT